MQIDIPKLIDTDEGPFHYCIRCEEYKPVVEFYLCPRCKTGYQYRCIDCHKQRYRELNPVQPTEQELLEILLTRMGYDTKGDKTINEQFVEKVYEKSGVDLTVPMPSRRGKYKHLNPPHYGTKDYFNWYNKEIRRKKD